MPRLPRLSPQEEALWEKVQASEPLSDEEALFLYESQNLAFLGALATLVRQRLHGKIAYYNRNFHIEPTNICIYECVLFVCSQTRRAWRMGIHPRRDRGFSCAVCGNRRDGGAHRRRRSPQARY